MRRLALALFAAGLHAPSAAAQAEKPKPKRMDPTHADVSYGPHARHKLDFWQAKTEHPAPLLVFIHGGGWTGGDKSGLADGGIKPYLAHGIHVAAINYRYIQNAMDDKVEPPVKAPLHDAARAIQTLRAKAAEWNIDKTRVAATGGSAGACTSLWLAFHDDLADAKSADPIARESTRLTCAAVSGAQTSLDPKQVREWMPNAAYGGHAFGFKAAGRDRKAEFEACLAARDKVLPWIKEYSPIELVTKDDPPVLLTYGKQETPAVVGTNQKDPTHSAVYGLKLVEALKAAGVEGEVSSPEFPGGKYKSAADFVILKLTQK